MTTSAFIGDLLSQLKIVENGWVAERDQDGASCLRRMGTVNGIWLDVEFRALRVRDAFVDEVTVKDVRRFGGSLVQVSGNFAPRLHSQQGHCRTQGLITIQDFEGGIPFGLWEWRR